MIVYGNTPRNVLVNLRLETFNAFFPRSVNLYVIALPSFSSTSINPISRRLFNAGYIVPGLGLSPFLFAISFVISCPFIVLFESKKRIKNPNIPRISQQ